MPPAAKKDCSVILFDLKSQKTAKQALVKICCTNFFTDTKDLTKLVLLNSNVTANRLNGRYGGYNNIHEVSEDVTVYDPRLLLGMIEENEETQEANWLEGLYVALKNLDEAFREIGGIITHQILFITDLKTPLAKPDPKLIDKIVNSLKQLDAFLYVVGPDVEPPFTIKTQKHVKLWMENFNTSKNPNLEILNQIISKSDNSVVCNYKMGIHLFFSYKKWGGTQPWQVPLAIGSKIQIPAQTMKILNEDVQIKLTSTQGAIRNPTWVDAEDETIEFDGQDVISGIIRHEKFVQMPDTKMFQVQNSRGFTVLCFTDSVNVPEYLLRGEGCYCVLPNSTPEKNEALNILIDCLAEQNKYVIARRVYNNNFRPRIVALIPKPDHNPKCFLLATLPYGDDVRVNYRERRVESAPKVDISEEVYKYLDSINIDSEDSDELFPLGVSMMLNRQGQRIVNKGADKLFDSHWTLSDLDLDLIESQPSGKAFEVLKSTWTQRSLKEEKRQKDLDNSDSDEDFDWS